MIIGLMSVSLIGIIVVQLLWIKNAVEVKTEQFDKSVNTALNNVVNRLERNENFFILSENMDILGNQFHIRTMNIDSLRQLQFRAADSLQYRLQKSLEFDESQFAWVEEEISSSYKVTSQFDSTNDNFGFEVEISHSAPQSGTIVKKTMPDSTSEVIISGGSGHYFLDKSSDSTKIFVSSTVKKINHRADELNNMLQQMVVEVQSVNVPIKKRLSKDYLNGEIQRSLRNQGIEAPYEFAVVSGTDKQLLPVKSDGFNPDDIAESYKTSLFPNDLFHVPNFLLLTFPDRNMHVLKSLMLLLAGSGIFTLIILITFSITIYVILHQKKVSEIKSDFINNMTHEFKTPIATISLAADSINSPKVIGSPDMIRYFTGIIRDENRRMNTQVENVLQMALIDKKDFNLRIQETDIHEIITRAVNNIRLQAEKKHGEVVAELNASNPVIETDEIHFYNIINNLLDNALKYTNGNPLIRVKTEDSGSGLKISVEDNGIGISKEEQHRIFDKFYRVSSGDIHNVKGFGLGLSYVKALVLAFGGSLKVVSEPGRGSTFEIFLPGMQ